MRPHFTLAGIPVYVRASFFVVTVMLGATKGATPQSIALWVAIVFVSVLAHEVGHAFMGRAFGLQPSVQLVGMGGLTSWEGGRNVGPGRSLLISLAGPAVGISIGGGALLLGALRHAASPLAAEAAWDIVWVNLGWGLLNLVPMMPLDGGNAMRAVLGLVKLGDAELLARGVSIAVGLGVGVLALSAGALWPVLLIAMYTMQNIKGIRERLAARGDDALLADLQTRYPGWLASGDGASMLRAASHARAAAKTARLQAFATEVSAMGQALGGDPRSALATLGAMPEGYVAGPSVLVFVLEEAGEYAAARKIVEGLLASGQDPALRAELARLEALERQQAADRSAHGA
jgi:hypothetical protein